jgi:hypothetical protein
MIKRMMKLGCSNCLPGYYFGVAQMTYLMRASVSVESLSVVDITTEEENLKRALCAGEPDVLCYVDLGNSEENDAEVCC